VNPFKVHTSGRQWVDGHDLVNEAGQTNAIKHGLQTLGALWMARPREVLEIGSMSGEQHSHERDAIGRSAAAKFLAPDEQLPSRR